MSEGLSFDAGWLERWAAFSGDRNPIHFDRDAARALGVADVVVHGMIPTLLVHEAAALKWGPGHSRAAWVECRTRLRRPVLVGRRVAMDLRLGGERLQYAVRGEDGEAHIHGVMAPVAAEGGSQQGPAAGVPLPPLLLDEGPMRDRAAAFSAVFPGVESGWVALSGILFAAFLAHAIPALREAALRTLGLEAAAGALVVQTTQGVSLDEGYFAGRPPAALAACECRFAPAGMYLVGGGCAADCRWQVRCGARPVMEMSVGLLMKTPQLIETVERS